MFLSKWKWFLLSAVIALGLAYLNIRYTIPEYKISSQIQVVQEKNAASELSVFKDLDILSGNSREIEDEIQILGSRSNYIEVVKELGTNIKIVSLGNIINSEVYGNEPFNINVIAPDSTLNKAKYKFYIELNSDTSYYFSEDENGPNKV